YATEKQVLPVVNSRRALKFAKVAGARKAIKNAPVYAEPSARALLVGHVVESGVVEAMALYGKFVQVRLGPGRFGFVESADLRDVASQPTPAVSFKPTLSHSPPVVEVSAA